MRDAIQKITRFKNHSILPAMILLIHLTCLVYPTAALPDDTRTQLGRLSNSVTSVAFSPDGRFLISPVVQDNSDAAPQPLRPVPLSRALPENAITQLDYSSPVYAVAFSPNGKLLVSGVSDNTVQLWDTVAQRELSPLTGHKDWVKSVAFSPNGKLLASASADKTVKLWNVDSGHEIKTLRHRIWVQTVQFSADGQTLASGSYDGKIRTWSVDTTSRWFGIRINENFTVEGHRGAVSSIAFSPNADTLASGSYDGTVKLWAVRDEPEIRHLNGHSHSVYAVAFSPDGKMLASGSSDNAVKLWDVSTRKAVATLEHIGYVEALSFSPDGKMLATALTSVNDNVNLWDVSSRTKLASLKGHTDGVTSVAFSPEGTMLATGSRDGTVLIWNLRDVVPIPPPPDTVPPEIAIHYPPNSPFTVKADVRKIIVSGRATDSSGIAEVRVNAKKVRVLETGAFKAEVALDSGANNISIVATDMAGNPAKKELIVNRGGDNTPPEIVINPPIPPVTSAEMLLISGRAVDASGISEVTVNGVRVQVSPTGAFKEEVALRFGNNRIIITATDTWGNRKTEEVTVTREDNTPPKIVINFPPESPFTVAPDDDKKIVTGNVTDNSGEIPEVTVNGEPVRVLPNGAFKAEVTLAPGENHITITATDRSGNKASEVVTFIRNPSLTIDINYPRRSPFTVEEGDKQIIIAGTVGPARGIRDVTVNEEPVRVLETGTFKAEVPLNYGENPISVVATDEWGLTATTTLTIIRPEREEPDDEGPELFIDSPPGVRGFQPIIVVTEKELTLAGRAQDASGIAEVRVNDERVPVSETGQFVKDITLVLGENRIHVTATDTLGNEAVKNLIIDCVERNGYVREGKDYALLFAVNEYEHWQKLHNPSLDAMKIKTELEDTYGFETELILNPTMQEVFAKLREYAAKTYHPEDQVMIFFAGHGYFDEIIQIGYLVARDTELPDKDRERISYISHPLLKERIDNIACKHIFLMIDACFSGTLDHELLTHRGEKKPVNIKRVMQYQTRRYMTSGGNEYVPDKSEFAYRVLEALRNGGGEDGTLTLDELFSYVKQARPKPRQGKFGHRNEPGSDFLFITK